MTEFAMRDWVEMDRLLATHQAALFELRENLARLQELVALEDESCWPAEFQEVVGASNH